LPDLRQISSVIVVRYWSWCPVRVRVWQVTAGEAAGAAVQLATSYHPESLVVLHVTVGPAAGFVAAQVPEFCMPVSEST
jgi:hypothetical protein